MKTINLLLTISLLIIAITQNVQAYQEKIAMRECTYSYNDRFFKPWNETQQSGVIMKITNRNLNFGPTQTASYLYNTSYQPQRVYRSADITDPRNGVANSSIPMLEVRKDLEGFIYINCSYSANERFWFSYYAAACGDGCGNSVGLTLTYDFNLSKGLKVNDTRCPFWTNGDTPNSCYTRFDLYDYGWTTFYPPTAGSHYNLREQAFRTDVIYYADNGNRMFGNINPSWSINAQNPITQALVTDFIADGVYRTNNLVVLSAVNISYLASGMLEMANAHGENGFGALFAYPDNWLARFYINSSVANLSDIITPATLNQTFVNLDTGKFNYGCYWDNISACTRVKEFSNISVNYTFKNFFNVPITGTFSFGSYLYSGGGGFGGYQTEILTFYHSATTSITGTIPPGQTVTFKHNTTIPANTYVGALGGTTTITRNNEYPIYNWYLLAGDDGDYLVFGGLSLFISLVNSQPAFNVTVELLSLTNLFNNNSNISYTPGVNRGFGEQQYDIQVKIMEERFIGDPGIEVDNITIRLNQQNMTNLLGTTSIFRNSYTPINIIIPITSQYLGKAGSKFKPKIAAIKRTAPFQDKITTVLTINPYFQAGDVMYAAGNVFNVINYHRTDHLTTWLFNPDFSGAHTITLNVTQLFVQNPLDKTKFRFYVNDTTTHTMYGPYDLAAVQQINFTLGPIEQRRLDLIIESLYSVWPNDHRPANNFTLVAVSDQQGVNPTTLLYSINVSKFNARDCSEISDPNSCLAMSLSGTACYVNYTGNSVEGTSPPGNLFFEPGVSDPSLCLNCTDTIQTLYCGNYDNQLSCEANTCFPTPPRGFEEFSGCSWYKVPFTIAKYKCVPVKGLCSYTTTNTCTNPASAADGTLSFTVVAGPASCQNYSITIPCEGYVKLPFASTFSLLLSLVIISLSYLFYKAKP